jgi:hypothetical protein
MDTATQHALDRLSNRLDSTVGADTSEAVRRVIVDHVDALGQDVLVAGLRSIDDGDEILLVVPSRLVTIRVTRSPATVTFEVKSLRDATISFETTAVGMVVHQVQSDQRWEFRFPDGTTVEIRGTTRGDKVDELEAVARAAMEQIGRAVWDRAT